MAVKRVLCHCPRKDINMDQKQYNRHTDEGHSINTLQTGAILLSHEIRKVQNTNFDWEIYWEHTLKNFVTMTSL